VIDFKLYLITDRKLFKDRSSLSAALEEALQGGVRALQLREKDLCIRDMLEMAYEMREITKKHGAKLFINDRVDVAKAVDADGVHLGGSGIHPQAARKAAGGSMIIGVSTHSMEQAKNAEREGADFITLGPVYETPAKMRYGAPLGRDIIEKVKDGVSVPVFAIGGIKKERVGEVLKAGACGIALISGILGSGDIYNETKEFMRLLK
jgi:thiamine-phosphate pyrophosphorylase